MNVTTRAGENVYAVLCHHRPSCKLADAGSHGITLPDRFCSCGAVHADLSREVHRTHNLVTTTGLRYYSQRGLDGTTDETWADIVLIENNLTEALGDDADDITGTVYAKAFDGSYPTLSDSDANNPGAPFADGTLVITYKTTYTTGEANATINNVCISESAAVFGGASGDPLLMHASFASSFTKTSSDTLAVYVNHTFQNA